MSHNIAMDDLKFVYKYVEKKSSNSTKSIKDLRQEACKIRANNRSVKLSTVYTNIKRALCVYKKYSFKDYDDIDSKIESLILLKEEASRCWW